MKNLLMLFFILFFTVSLNAQSVKVYHENFDDPYNGDSITADGAVNNFSINSRLFYSGSQCDSSLVTASDTAFLTTNSFSTLGLQYVRLTFSHICKIETFDVAEIQVSVSNGPWVKLTGSQYLNPGNSQFVNYGNRFNSGTYSTLWMSSQNNAKPDQTWWKSEIFNIGALVGNQSDVRLRFLLRDDNGNGANLNRGWYIDNVDITASASELNFPTVHLKAPIYQDTLFTTGAFNVYTYIQDASGIDSAYIIYKVNGGPAQYAPMVWLSDSTYIGILPSFTFNTRIDYSVRGIDNSNSHNIGSSSNQWIYIKRPKHNLIVGTGTLTSSDLPVNADGNWGWGAMVYRANELSFNGVIDSIGFFISNTTSNYIMSNQKVWIGQTPFSSYVTVQAAQTDTSNMTLVYDGTVTFNGTGWFRIKLANYFYYDGISNLAIYWTNKDGSAITTGYPIFACTSTTPVLTCGYVSGNTYSNIFPTSWGNETYYRPNLKISINQSGPNIDAGIKQITEPTGVVFDSDSIPVKAIIKNYAIDTLYNVTVKWSVDDVIQPDSIIWTGMLPEQVSAIPFTFTKEFLNVGNHTICAWTVNPNSHTDTISANDSSCVSFYLCHSILNGTYTIGSGGDFLSVRDAVSALINCGISGPVVFNILSGTYDGQINVPSISGTSATNTVTFQSATGVNSSVIIQYAASSSADNFVLRLNGADYTCFKNLTIKSTSTSTYGTVIELINGADYNSFEGNVIQSVYVINSAGIYSYFNSSDNYNLFKNNKINSGFYGIYFDGSSGSHKKGNKFIGNNISDWNVHGINIYNNDSVQIIQDTIQSNVISGVNYGIYADHCYFGCKILNNWIKSIHGNFFGIYFYNPITTPGYRNLIANNFITQSIGQSSSDGIYLYGASYTDVYFNSILITGSTALYSGGGTTGINIINNILCNTGGGNAIYVSLTTPIVKCDYNDIYTTGSYFGHWGTSNASNFISWKNLTQKDSNSVSCDPQFISDTDLHASSSCIMNKGFPLLSVTDDIDNEPRSITQPTIGADEINIITGELESENKKNIGIFPNPSTGLININFAESTTENNVEIVNSIGEVILTKVISHQSSTTLDLSNHAKGIYFIKAQNGNGVVARKLIVE